MYQMVKITDIEKCKALVDPYIGQVVFFRVSVKTWKEAEASQFDSFFALATILDTRMIANFNNVSDDKRLRCEIQPIGGDKCFWIDADMLFLQKGW